MSHYLLEAIFQMTYKLCHSSFKNMPVQNCSDKLFSDAIILCPVDATPEISILLSWLRSKLELWNLFSGFERFASVRSIRHGRVPTRWIVSRLIGSFLIHLLSFVHLLNSCRCLEEVNRRLDESSASAELGSGSPGRKSEKISRQVSKCSDITMSL